MVVLPPTDLEKFRTKGCCLMKTDPSVHAVVVSLSNEIQQERKRRLAGHDIATSATYSNIGQIT